MRLALSFLAIAILAVACSTKKVTVAPAESLERISSAVVINVHSQSVDASILEDLTRHLKAKLIVAGFDIEAKPPDAIRLEVHVHEFEPGNAALRLTVGFGAGRGSLLYTARYLDSSQTVLAELEGQERFTGGEPHYNMDYGQATTLMGAERVQSVLVQEAAKHIVELGLGKIRAPKPAAQRSTR